MVKLGLCCVLLARVTLLPAVSSAATYTVNTTADTHSTGFTSQSAPNSTTVTDNTGHISLRSALEYASTVGGATTVNLPAGTYNLSLGDLVAGTSPNTTITVQGQDSASTIINQTQPGRMIFVVNYNVNQNVVFNLSSVTITGGSENETDPDGFGGNGGAILAGGSATATGNVVTLTSVVFSGNYCSPVSNAGAAGGAVEMTGGGNLNVFNCTFTGNAASKNRGFGGGGAINFDNGGHPGNVFISGSSFFNNVAAGTSITGGVGGALALAGGTAGTFTITGCTFLNNTCGGGTSSGGAIYAVSGNLTGSFNRFLGNTAASGGAVYIGNNAATMGDLRNNWWGGNNGPNTAGSDTTFPATTSSPPLAQGQIAFNPWLKLNHYANPASILTGGATTLTASFLTNSAGNPIAAGNLGAMVGLPITFNNAVTGSISSAQGTIQGSGTATALFTAGAIGGIGSANATFDNATSTAFITVNQPPTVTSANHTTFTVSNAGTFAFTAVGLPAPGLSATGALPGGVTYDSVNRALVGTPAAGSGGLYNLAVSATNSVGTNIQSFTLTVLEPAPTVHNVSDNGPGSLRYAIAYAASNASITFDPGLSGGGIVLTNGQLLLANNLTIDGSALLGGIKLDGNHAGRIFAVNGGFTVTLNGLTITNGYTTNGNWGGAIFNGGTLVLSNCTFVGNSGDSSIAGGAIANQGPLMVTGCTFAGNSAGFSGAIDNRSTCTLRDCTFFGNVAFAGNGGAIDNPFGATLSVLQCTFSGNSATSIGGGIDNYQSQVNLTNTIVAGNSGMDIYNWSGGAVTAGGTNIVQLLGNAGTLSGASAILTADPRLAPLASYGGPTQTMPPQTGSPAVDAGSDAAATGLATDQRGYPRISGAHVDIGAVEGAFNPAFPLTGVSRLGNGALQFGFANLSGPSYTVLANTNVAAPLNTWSSLGAPAESPPGVFQFTDPAATNYPQRFYRVRGP